jgi:M-phase phosphoprotein-6
MQRAKEKELRGDAVAGAAPIPTNKKAVDDRPEPAIFAKNRALINLPRIRKKEEPPVEAPFNGLGRISFGGANPEVERAHERLRERRRQLKALKRARASKDTDIADDEMAAAAFAAKKSKKKRTSGSDFGFVRPPELGSKQQKKGKN